jgi:hypothetical protein
VDVLAQGLDDHDCWGFIFEIKNRSENNWPTMPEAQLFVTKIEQLQRQVAKTGKTIKMICPIYLSAEGFELAIEQWLQAQGILTTNNGPFL